MSLFTCYFYVLRNMVGDMFLFICYWASEASPTLGCSIEISVCQYVCLSCPKMRRQNYVRACSKSVLGCIN